MMRWGAITPSSILINRYATQLLTKLGHSFICNQAFISSHIPYFFFKITYFLNVSQQLQAEYLFRWRKVCLGLDRQKVFYFKEMSVNKMPSGTMSDSEIASLVRKMCFCSMFFNIVVFNLTNPQFTKSSNHQFAKLPYYQIVNLPKCQTAKFPSNQIAKLSNCQMTKLPNCQNTK